MVKSQDSELLSSTFNHVLMYVSMSLRQPPCVQSTACTCIIKLLLQKGCLASMKYV